MKVLLLHDPYKPIESGSVGGEDNLAQLEIEVLRGLGVEVIDARIFDDGISRKLNQIRANSFGSPKQLENLILRSNPDVIHTHNLNQRSGYEWMKHTEVPIVSSLHNYRLFCPASIAWRDGQKCFECRDLSVVRAITHNCEGKVGVLNSTRMGLLQRDRPEINQPKLFLTSSDYMSETLLPIVPAKKMRVLRNPGNFIDSKDIKKTTRTGWIFAGRFVREKGLVELIENWPEEEKLDIAGTGPLLSEIKRLIQDKNNIKLIGTYPPGTADIFTHYEGSIFPSTWGEGSPLVNIDSIGVGTPVICTDQSAACEQVKITGSGFVISGRLTVENIRVAQSYVRANFIAMSANGIRAVQNQFSRESWGLKLKFHLEEAVD